VVDEDAEARLAYWEAVGKAGWAMSDQDKRDDVPPSGTAAVVARMVAEYFHGRPNDTANIQVTRDNYAGTLTIEIRPESAEPRDFAEAALEAVAGILDGSAPVIDGSAVKLPPGEHVVHLTVDTTQPAAPAMPVPMYKARTFDRALSPEEIAARRPAQPANGCGTDTPNWDGPTYWNDDDRRRDYCSQACADARRHVDPAETQEVDRLSRNIRDVAAWQAAGCPPGLVTGMGTAPADHPAPWIWNWRQDPGDAQPQPAGWVTDANGSIVLSGAEPASPLARELIRLAPQMEALLRNPDLWDGTGHKSGCFDPDEPCDNLEPCWKHKLVPVLAALDAARKAK